MASTSTESTSRARTIPNASIYYAPGAECRTASTIIIVINSDDNTANTAVVHHHGLLHPHERAASKSASEYKCLLKFELKFELKLKLELRPLLRRPDDVQHAHTRYVRRERECAHIGSWEPGYGWCAGW